MSLLSLVLKMFYSRFLFLRKVNELSHGLRTIYELNNNEVDEIIQTYIRKMYEYGVVDFRVESAARPEYFEDRAVQINNQWKSNWQDWDVETFQFTTGLLEDIFVVLLYRPDESVTRPVRVMEKYLPEWVENSDSED